MANSSVLFSGMNYLLKSGLLLQQIISFIRTWQLVAMDVVLVFLLLTWNIFHTFF